MDTKDYNEKKLDYIHGDLSKEEELAFKEELKQNPQEAKKVEIHKRIIDQGKLDMQLEEILNDPGYKNAQIQAKKAVKDYEKKKRRAYFLSTKFPINYVYYIAAGIVGFLIVGNFVFFISSPENAFKKYYKEYKPIYYAQATINDAQALYVHSFDLYTNGDYEAVASNMHILMKEGNLNVPGQIMLAFYDAWNMSVIDKIKGELTTKDDAAWYLAITSLKFDELQRAKTLFAEIAAGNSDRAKKAARMERKVSKMLLDE